MLAPLPRGASAPAEIRIRLDLLESGRINDLLHRLELQQPQTKAAADRRRPTNPTNDTARTARKAIFTAAEGAYAKAAAGLTTQLMHLTPEQDREYAALLIPKSLKPEQALYHAPADYDPPPSNRDDEVATTESPLRGVSYAKLTGPGPSGTRPDHVKEMLAVPRAREPNGLLRSPGPTSRRDRTENPPTADALAASYPALLADE